MAKFLTQLVVSPLPDGRNWRVNAPLKFVTDEGGVITVPAGFVTDFASIPPIERLALIPLVASFALCLLGRHWPAVAVFAVGGWLVWAGSKLNTDDELDAPATVHDYLYRVVRSNRMVADAVLYQAMKCAAIPGWERAAVYASVRLFGAAAWRSDAKPKADG